MDIVEIFSQFKFHFTIVHVLAVVSGMGAALISDVLFSFYGKDKILTKYELKKLLLLSRIVWVSLAFIILSGIAIFLSNPEVYSVSHKFLSKMTVVLVITINGYILHHFVQPHMSRKFLTLMRERVTRKIAFTCGAISLISWLCAFVLGLTKNMPLVYGEIMFIYASVIILAIFVSLKVEKRTFE